jgi:hypothetical protein
MPPPQRFPQLGNLIAQALVFRLERTYPGLEIHHALRFLRVWRNQKTTRPRQVGTLCAAANILASPMAWSPCCKLDGLDLP